MSPNQRSEMNNQTNNGANEKGTPGSKGKTTDGPMDHTHPAGAAQQQSSQQPSEMGSRQSGMGPGPQESGSGNALPGGSMQTQQSGGTGAVTGITDSHQRQMEQRSQAYGQLEQPVGDRDADSGTSLRNQQTAQQSSQQSAMQSGTNGGGQLGGQPPRQGGSMGGQQTGMPPATQGGGVRGRQSEAPASQQSTDRSGSQTGAGHRQGEPAVHESNDAAGGLPKSPRGANRLAADRKMDDDTGLSNTVNQQAAVDEGSKQIEQSNVGRRDDMTPD